MRSEPSGLSSWSSRIGSRWKVCNVCSSTGAPSAKVAGVEASLGATSKLPGCVISPTPAKRLSKDDTSACQFLDMSSSTAACERPTCQRFNSAAK
eukprot:2625054-Amphidinium_carterae.1